MNSKLLQIIIASLLGIFQITQACAQDGFILAYDFEKSGLAFHNSVIRGDTVFVVGSVKSDDNNIWGLVFAKFDSLGNVLDYHEYYDSLGDHYIFEQGYGFISTEDFGFAAVGQLFARNHPVLFKLDALGNLQFVEEYPDDVSLNSRHWNIIENDEGFISIGSKQSPIDSKTDAFFMGTDKNGQKLWEVSYGEFDLYDTFRGLYKISNNEFLITGGSSIGSNSVPSLYDAWRISKQLKIDAIGTVVWEQEGQIEYFDESRSSPTNLIKDIDGNWVHVGQWGDVIANDEIVFQGEILKRDTNFNIIWSSRFGNPTSVKNRFIDLAITPDGGWVAAGQNVILDSNSQSGGYIGGWLAKTNANGDSLWSRTDTVFWNAVTGSENYLSSVNVLSTGSILAIGHLNRNESVPPKSYGWIIKVDSNGCLNAGCVSSSHNIDQESFVQSFDFYPNPASDFINVSSSSLSSFDIFVFDSNGKLLYSDKSYNKSASIDLGSYPAGTFYLRLNSGNQGLIKKIVKIEND